LGEISVTLLFVFSWSLSGFLIDLPFTIYRTFVIEEKHGFNKEVQTVG
jgi:STE24 endopeptidase